MWYVYDLSSISGWSWSCINRITLCNSEIEETIVLDLYTGCYSYIDRDHKVLKQHEFDKAKGLKYLMKHRRKILGVVSDCCFKEIIKNDIKLLSYIGKPKLCIRRVSGQKVFSPVKGDKFRMLFNTSFLGFPTSSSRKFKLQVHHGNIPSEITTGSLLSIILVYHEFIGSKCITIPVRRLRHFEFCYKYKIKDYKEFNRFITKCIVLEEN